MMGRVRRHHVVAFSDEPSRLLPATLAEVQGPDRDAHAELKHRVAPPIVVMVSFRSLGSVATPRGSAASQ